MSGKRQIYGPKAASRKILHLDLDAFFCSVEELDNPTLKGKAFAVGGQPGQRGVVASCSYAARQKGVRSAMPMSRAVQLCPELIIVRSAYRRYSEYSRKVMDILGEYTAQIQQVSVDEAFMDLTDLPQSGEELARAIQQQVNARLHLPCSLGVASNKLVAKVACDTGKARHHGITAPNSILVIPPGEEEAFLSPLPVQAIWGIGPKTAARLEQKGIHRVADLIALGEEGATRLLGNFGRDLLARARGQDDRPVYTGGHEAKSISHEVTYDRDISDLDELEGTLRWQSSDVARRLRRSGLSGSTVRIKIRWPDFTTHTRQLTIPGPTDLDNQIYEAARTLFHQIWKPGRKVRLLGVGVSGLEQSVHQPGLWDNTTDRERRLREALDKLRNRYGDKAVIPAKRLEKKSREG